MVFKRKQKPLICGVISRLFCQPWSSSGDRANIEELDNGYPGKIGHQLIVRVGRCGILSRSLERVDHRNKQTATDGSDDHATPNNRNPPLPHVR